MKILIATSGNYDPETDSTHATFTFPWPKGSEFHILTVAEVTFPVMVGMTPDPVDTTDIQMRSSEDVRSIADSTARRFRELGFSAEGFGLQGEPETEIIEHAKSWGADLIVVGWHDRSRLERFLAGSVSEDMVKKAPCSVLVLKYSPAVV